VHKRKFYLTYIFKFFEYLTAFFTLFFVTPKITSSLPTTVYGIYTGVLSFFVFLKYSDFGFLRAAEKYACDEFIQNNRIAETKILAFGSFVQFCIIFLFSILLFYFYLHPEIIFNNLTYENYQICSNLFLISAVLVFFTIPNRVLSIIAGYKIETYKITPWIIFINILNILNVYIIFKVNDNKNIITYYLISSILNYIILTIVFIYYFIKWGYSFQVFFINFKFNINIYKKLTPYASSIIVSIISHIIYFELDSIYLLKKYPSSQYAFYAIALSLSNYFRNINSIIFAPFAVKYNELYINEDKIGMQNLFYKNISLVLPITFLPVLITILTMPEFINSWLGDKYFQSILIAKVLLISYLFSTFSETSSLVINSLLKIKTIYIAAILTPIFYWLIILIFTPIFGIISVAYAKTFSFIFESLFFTYQALRHINQNTFYFIKKIIYPLCITSFFTILFFYFFKSIFLNTDKYSLPTTLFIIIINYLFSIIFYFIFNHEFRKFLLNQLYIFIQNNGSFIFK
jgi:O-antigen/teichoic acid export membrane protein